MLFVLDFLCFSQLWFSDVLLGFLFLSGNKSSGIAFMPF